MESISDSRVGVGFGINWINNVGIGVKLDFFLLNLPSILIFNLWHERFMSQIFSEAGDEDGTEVAGNPVCRVDIDELQTELKLPEIFMLDSGIK